MSHAPLTLVTGATGTTGSRTVAQLAAEGHRVRAASRRAPSVAEAHPVRFDWYDATTHAGALDGVERVYLVPPPGELEPAALMVPFLRRARAAGVRRAVLLSSSAIPAGGPAVGVVHRALPELFAEWAVLRPSWFMQNVVTGHLHAESARAEGVLRTATGRGRVGFVDAGDIAAVAVRALCDVQAPRTDLVLTGPQALSYDEVAALLSEFVGAPVTHQRLSVAQLRARLAGTVPPEFAALLADLDRGIADGAEDRVTDAVPRLTGRKARDLRSVLEREWRA